jgi:hypothetical protein
MGEMEMKISVRISGMKGLEADAVGFSSAAARQHFKTDGANPIGL